VHDRSEWESRSRESDHAAWPKRSADGFQIADYERLTVFLFRLAAAPRSSKSVAAPMVNRWSLQKLGLIPAVYIRVLRRVGRMEVVDQLVKPHGQDDDES
jgi:hypothetical protein